MCIYVFLIKLYCSLAYFAVFLGFSQRYKCWFFFPFILYQTIDRITKAAWWLFFFVTLISFLVSWPKRAKGGEDNSWIVQSFCYLFLFISLFFFGYSEIYAISFVRWIIYVYYFSSECAYSFIALSNSFLLSITYLS